MTTDADIDAPFRHYTMSHRVVAWVSTRLFGSFEYTVRRGLLSGMKRHGGLGFVPGWIGNAVSREDRFWQSLALDDAVVLDVGAFEGLLSLYFSTRARRVVAYEPMPRNRKYLQRNLELNAVRNVTVRPLGLGSTRGEITLAAMSLMPGGTSGDPEVSVGIEAASNVVHARVPVNTLDEEWRDGVFPAPDLLKVDVEGMEAAVLRGATALIAATRPSIYLELHGETIRQKRAKTAELLELLRGDLGYRTVMHVEASRPVEPADAVELFEGHLFAAGDRLPWPGAFDAS